MADFNPDSYIADKDFLINYKLKHIASGAPGDEMEPIFKGSDIAPHLANNPYLQKAAEMGIDNIPMIAGFLSGGGVRATIKGVKNLKGSKIADASEAFAARGAEPPSTETKINQMYGETGEVRDAMPKLVDRAGKEWQTAERKGISMEELNAENFEHGVSTQRSAYENPKNAPPKIPEYGPGKDALLSPQESKALSDRIAQSEKVSLARPKTYLTPSKAEPNVLYPMEDFPGPRRPVVEGEISGPWKDDPRLSDHAKGLLERVGARLGDNFDSVILKAQDGPSHLPYINDKKSPVPIANFGAKPTGVIGEDRIQGMSLTGKGPDPFSWMDDKYRSAKELLKKHADANMPVEINTSSDLIGRDDYIAALPIDAKINFHLLSPNEKLNRILFPGNASYLRQTMAVERLKNAGVNVNVVLPTVEEYISAAEKAYGKKGRWNNEEIPDLEIQLQRSGLLTDAQKAAGALPMMKPKGGE